MAFENTPRLKQQAETVEAMIRLYCAAQHKHAVAHDDSGLCPDCDELVAYTRLRLEKCPFGDAKPTCGTCKIHCYKAAPRAQIRTVMRYAGPRMLLRHPLMAVRHLWDERSKPPPIKRTRKA